MSQQALNETKACRKRITLYLYRLFDIKFKKDRIVTDLKKMSLKEGDVVFVHSSLSKIGYVEGGPSIIIDALIEIVGPSGTIVMPAFTINRSMKQTLDSEFLFNPKSSKVTVGLIPETFRKKQGVYRSLHPTHSVSAYGKLAKWITDGHEVCKTTFGIDTPFHKFLQVNGKILGIGIDLGPVTFYHVIEDIEKNFPIKVYNKKAHQIKLLNYEGKAITMKIKSHRHNIAKTRIDHEENLWIRNFLTRYLREKKMIREELIGKAHSWIIPARDLYEAQQELLLKEVTIYTTKEEYLLKKKENSDD